MKHSARLRLPAFWKNPVLVKEIRTRMRGKRAFIILTAHLLTLGMAVFLAYLVFQLSSSSTTTLENRRVFGKSLFGLLVWMELVMISFTAPALTSGAIAAERERQTYDLLRCHPAASPLTGFGQVHCWTGFYSATVVYLAALTKPCFSHWGCGTARNPDCDCDPDCDRNRLLRSWHVFL